MASAGQPYATFGSLPLGAHRAGLTDDERAIVDLEEELATCHTMESLTAKWDQDAVLFDIAPGEVVGLDTIRRNLGEQYKYVTDIETTILKMRVEAGADIGFAYSVQRITAKGQHGAPDLDWVFRMTDCFHKREGAWLLVHQHVSLPADIPSGKFVTG